MTWTVIGKNLSDKNKITVDVKNYKVVMTVAEGALTLSDVPAKPVDGTAEAALPTTAPTTTQAGLGTISAVTWAETTDNGTANQVDSTDVWTATFTIAADDGYQFVNSGTYTLDGATVTATTTQLTVVFTFTID